MLLCALHLINQDTPLRNNQRRPQDAFFFCVIFQLLPQQVPSAVLLEHTLTSTDSSPLHCCETGMQPEREQSLININ